MKQLFAPWRTKYTQDDVRKGKENTKDACVFCSHPQEDNDKQNLLLQRNKYTYVMMNKYPYNAGHLLVLPYEHVANLEDCSQEVLHELMESVTCCTKIVKDVLGAQAVNIGANLGKIAGAGMPNHVHFHVLPRWHGDTNFLPTIADTKQISVDMIEIYERLLAVFNK